MRMLLDVTIPVESGNASIKGGELPKLLMATIDQIHPESSYFYPLDGKRHFQMVFDLKDSSQIPPIAERLFEELKAEVRLMPVMNLEDLKKGLSQIGKK